LEETYKLEGVKPIKSAADLGLEEDWLNYGHTGK
jgi:hypothetical protein